MIATSGPSSTYPQRAYRNPTDALVKFLDLSHGENWAIWEFRAEGTGYPDSEVYGRIRHYPWPDHHPPPFALIPNIMASMRDWLKESTPINKRVVVVHCKAGKGRSGTVACSYLISEEGWSVDAALTRFTERRMRSGFGAGVSIPSQLRWVGYVSRWAKHGKLYVERQVEVLEVHVWGLREGVKVGINGYVDEGKTIKTFHIFRNDERIVVDDQTKDGASTKLASSNESPVHNEPPNPDLVLAPRPNGNIKTEPLPSKPSHTGDETGGRAVIFRPSIPIILPSNDIDIDFERRNKAPYGWTMVTSVAHVWFNTYFDGSGPEQHGTATPSGVFEIAWDDMDGIKGSARKGVRALDRLAAVWRAVDPKDGGTLHIINEPKAGEPVPETHAADWKGMQHAHMAALGKDLGLRSESPASRSVSKASSLTSARSSRLEDDPAVGVRPHGLAGEDHIPTTSVVDPDPEPNRLNFNGLPSPLAESGSSHPLPSKHGP